MRKRALPPPGGAAFLYPRVNMPIQTPFQILEGHAPRTDGSVNMVDIVIPSGVVFSDLELKRDVDGLVQFNWAPIEAICEASGIDSKSLKQAKCESVATLLVHWYIAHLGQGGLPDRVQEELMTDAWTEDWGPAQHTFPPGHA